MRPDVRLEVEIPRAAAPARRLALTGETDQLPRGDAWRNRYADGVVAQLERAVGLELGTLELEHPGRAPEGFLEIDFDARVMIAPRPAALRGKRRAAAEERREELAEVLLAQAAVLARAKAPRARAAPSRATRARPAVARELEAAAPVRRWTKLLAGFPLAAELVVRGALLGILEHFVGLLHFLEARLGVRLLAHVGVVLVSEPAIGLPDLVGARGALDSEDLVVVTEFHGEGNSSRGASCAVAAAGPGPSRGYALEATRPRAAKKKRREAGEVASRRAARTRGICSQLERDGARPVPAQQSKRKQ